MTETPDAMIVSDQYRPVVIAQRRHGGGVVIGRGARFIALGRAELDRLIDFARGCCTSPQPCAGHTLFGAQNPADVATAAG